MISRKLLSIASVMFALSGCGGGGGTGDQPVGPALAPAAAEAPQLAQSIGAEGTPVRLYLAFYGMAPGNPAYTDYLSMMQASGPQAVALALAGQLSATSNSALASTVLTNLGITAATTNSAAYAALSGALAQIFGVYPAQRGVVVMNLVNILKDLEGNAAYGAAAQTFNATTSTAYTYAIDPTHTQAQAITPAGPVLSGMAAKGPLNGATVGVYNLNSDGSKGTLLASGSTDSTGKFSVPLPTRPAGGVLLEANGGTYTSAYDGASVTSGKVSAMLDSVSSAGETGISVNPLTDMSVGLTRDYVSRGYALSASLATADKWVSWSFGLKTAPSKIQPKFDVTVAATDSEGVQLAMILAALDTLGKRLSPANPDAIFASLSADFADGFFDGMARTQQVSINGAPMAANTGTTEFKKAFAVTYTSTAAGWRPAYADAHFSAGTVTESYQAKIVPVYVASELAAYFPRTLTNPLPKTTSLDASATGYSCASGAQLSFSSTGAPVCGQGAYYSCYGATLITSSSGVSCSDGGIPIYHSAEIAVYTAPTLVPYTASTIQSYLATPTIGEPSTGTIPVYRATAAHVFTQAERDAMMANDRAAGDAAAAKFSGMGTPTALQMEWLGKINDAVVYSVADPYLYR